VKSAGRVFHRSEQSPVAPYARAEIIKPGMDTKQRLFARFECGSGRRGLLWIKTPT